MLNVFQINKVTDSIIKENEKVLINFNNSLKKDYKFLLPNDISNITELTLDTSFSNLNFNKLSISDKKYIL